MDQPPVDTHEPSIRHLVNQLIEDTADYARAEAEFFRAELGDRGRHLVPAVYLFIAAAIAGFALIITVSVVATIWLGLAIGFGWAILSATLVLSGVIALLVRSARVHLQKATRPWNRP
jgi:predicted RND superfamily exporter protein